MKATNEKKSEGLFFHRMILREEFHFLQAIPLGLQQSWQCLSET